MKIGVGKNRGKLVGEVIVADPAYVARLATERCPDSETTYVVEEAQRLVAILDAKVFLTTCSGCSKPATRCVVRAGDIDAQTWLCEGCKPPASGAGRRFELRTYEDTLHCGLGDDDVRVLIKALATAKGLSCNRGERHITEFFTI